MNYKQHTVAFGILLVAIFMGYVNSHGTEGPNSRSTKTGLQTIWSSFNTSSDTSQAIPEVPQVASRYHLRNRTTRAFQVAARYPLRNRTTRFFERAVNLRGVFHGQKPPTGEIHKAIATNQLAFQLA